MFIDRCLLMADCAVALQIKSTDEVEYTCVLPADYIDPDNEYHFLDLVKPQLFFSKQQNNETTNYLLESFEQTLPRYQLGKRLKDYGDYLASDWNEDNRSVPTVLFICPTVADLLYVKRRAKKLLKEEWSEGSICIRVTTLDRVQTSGVASMVWEEVQTIQ